MNIEDWKELSGFYGRNMVKLLDNSYIAMLDSDRRLNDLRQRLEWNIRAFNLMDECVKTNLTAEVCQLGIQNNKLALEALKNGFNKSSDAPSLALIEKRKAADDVKWLQHLWEL